MIVNQPFKLTETEGKYDVVINVIGGGLSGRSEAIRHGIIVLLLSWPREQSCS